MGCCVWHMTTEHTGPFLVVAYRWGWVNNGQYVVGLTNDREKAEALAVAESDDRGGKYGCTVYGVKPGAESCADIEAIFHSPSSYGEKMAGYNHRIQAFEIIGNRVAQALEGFFGAEKQVLPDWLKKIHDEEMATSEMFFRLTQHGTQ